MLSNLDSITNIRNPSSDNEVSNKKYVDSIEEGTIIKFVQTFENNPKVSVGNDVYNITIFDKLQFRDTTVTKNPNSVKCLLQNWVIQSSDKNKNSKIQNCMRSTKTHSPTGHSGAKI